MSYTLSPITLTENVTSQVNIPGDLGAVTFVKLTNASPYLLLLSSLLGGQDYLQPGECNIFAVPGLTTAIQVTPLPFISGTSTSPSSVLVVTWYGVDESPQGTAYPINFNTLSFVGNTVTTNGVTNAVTPVYNAQAYGAKGDGVTDDRAAIQSALDACNGAGGGMVYLPAGTYALGSYQNITDGTSNANCCLAIGSKTALVGAGMDMTTLKVTTIMPDQSICIVNRHYNTGGDTGLLFQDVTFDGNAAIQTATNHVNLVQVQQVAGCHFLRVRGKDSYGTGSSGAAEAMTLNADNSSNVSWVDCECVFTTTNTGGGMGSNYGTYLSFVNCMVNGSGKTMGFGIYGCAHVQYTNCHSYNNALNGFNCEESYNVTYTNCVAGGVAQSLGATGSYPFTKGQTLGNTLNGFRVAYSNSHEVYYVNCIAQNNGANGFAIESACSNIHLYAPTGQNNGQYGLAITDATITSVWIDGRHVFGNNTLGNVYIYVNGTGYTETGGGAQPHVPAIPASGVLTTMPFPWKSMVWIPNGTVTNVSVNGGQQLAAAPGWILVPGFGQVTLTYSVAPSSWVWVPLQG